MKNMKISILFLILSLFFVAPFTMVANDNQDVLKAINKELKLFLIIKAIQWK
jgi:hypothetical protein